MNATNRHFQAVFLISGLSSLAGACGSSADRSVSGGGGSLGAGGTATGSAGSNAVGGNGNSAGADTAGSGVIVGDGKPFVPDDVKYALVDVPFALTLIDATLIDDGTSLYWVVAARNDETVPVCLPQMKAAFSNAVNIDGGLPGQAVVAIQGAMNQTKDLGVLPCLQPGEVGMGAQGVVPHDAGDPKTLQIDYQPDGFRVPEAAKIVGLAVENVKIASGAAGTNVTGSVANHGTAAAPGPELYLFPVDSGGRPYDFGYDSSTTDIAVGSSWTFQMTVPSAITKYVTFPVHGQQHL